MSKILITGASGFVGNWLIKEALEKGLETYAGIRKTSSKRYLTDERINFCYVDFDDPRSLRDLVNKYGFDYIIHNAGITRAQDNNLYYKVNSEYSYRLANISKEVLGSQLKKFVFISSIEAFGSADNTPSGVVDHSVTPSPRTTYGSSKLKGERELQKIHDLPLLVLRPTAVFGPGEKDLFAVWKTIKRFRFSPTIGDPNIKYSFVYVKDLARVVIDSALSEMVNKSYFVSDGRIYKIKDFTGSIADSLGVQTFGLTIPYPLLESAVGITKLYDKLTGSKSLLNDEQLAKMKAKSWDCDISDLVKDLNYQAKYNLASGISETTEWYIKEGWL